MKPRPYDMEYLSEITRWFTEMEGYLRTEDFVNQGTDKEGRQYAFDGFLHLKKYFLTTRDVKYP